MVIDLLNNVGTVELQDISNRNLLDFFRHSKIPTNGAQLSGKIIWTYELSKVYGWVSNQKDP